MAKDRGFPKEQILLSKRYSNLEKDILVSILLDKDYTLKEVDKLLKDFYSKEVS